MKFTSEPLSGLDVLKTATIFPTARRKANTSPSKMLKIVQLLKRPGTNSDRKRPNIKSKQRCWTYSIVVTFLKQQLFGSKKLLEYGIGGSTLYKYKSLWHPNLWKTPQTPQPLNGAAAAATATPTAAAHPTSLLPGDDSNPLQGKGLRHSEEAASASEVRNEDGVVGWRQLFLDLKTRQAQQKRQAKSQKEAYWQSRARQDRQSYREKMVEYLRSGDPILIREAEQWFCRESASEQNREPL